MGTKRKPHNHYAGYVFEKKADVLNGHLVCVIADEIGLDSDDKYLVLLERAEKENSRIGASFTSIPKARAFVNSELENPEFDWS